MTLAKNICIASLTILSAISPLCADSKDDFIAFLQARDNSIASYDAQLRQGHFDIALEEYDAFAEAVGRVEQMKIGDVNLSLLVENIAGKWRKNVTWMERHMLKQDERFKEISNSRQGTRLKTTVYDGQIYRVYSKHNGQLDLHPDIPPIVHLDFEYLGITTKRMRANGDLISYIESEQGPQCTFSLSKDNSRITTQEYDSDFNIRRSCYHRDGKLAKDSRLSFYNKVEGYSIPGLQIEMNLYKDRCSVYAYIVEDVKINCKLTDQDFAIGEMPPWTVVVDYRHRPPRRTQLIDYPREILGDSVMLDELSKAEAKRSQQTESEAPPTPSNDTEQTAVTEYEQSAQTVSQVEPHRRITASHIRYRWAFILLFFLVVAAAGLAIALSRRRK